MNGSVFHACRRSRSPKNKDIKGVGALQHCVYYSYILIYNRVFPPLPGRLLPALAPALRYVLEKYTVAAPRDIGPFITVVKKSIAIYLYVTFTLSLPLVTFIGAADMLQEMTLFTNAQTTPVVRALRRPYLM